MNELPDIEKVAALVHQSWMENKRKNGVISRKGEDGEELMVPYAKLSDKQKEQDRETVRTVYKAIRSVAGEKREVASYRSHRGVNG